MGGGGFILGRGNNSFNPRSQVRLGCLSAQLRSSQDAGPPCSWLVMQLCRSQSPPSKRQGHLHDSFTTRSHQEVSLTLKQHTVQPCRSSLCYHGTSKQRRTCTYWAVLESHIQHRRSSGPPLLCPSWGQKMATVTRFQNWSVQRFFTDGKAVDIVVRFSV